MSEVFHPCNTLAYDWQGKYADWMNNGKAPYAETTVVSAGDVLPDGTIVTTIEGGKCLMAQSGFVNAERQCCNFYMSYLNSVGNWDFRDLELLKIRLFTNHPEHPIKIVFATSPWTGYVVAELPAGTLPLRQWMTVGIDLRVSPQGSPDLTQGKALTIYASGLNGDRNEYYVLVNYMTLEKALGTVPLGCGLEPLSVNIEKGGIQTFSGRAWGGVPPYTVEWLLNGFVEKTEIVEEYTTSSYSFFGEKAGQYSLQIRVIDSDSPASTTTSEKAVIVVRESLPSPEPIEGSCYAVGNKLYDWKGRPLHLHGVHLHGFEDNPNGHWIDKNGGIHYGGDVDWSQIAAEWLPDELDGMRSWGVNSIRVHNSVELWLYNIGNVRLNFKQLLSECQKRGIYVVIDFYSIRYYGQAGNRSTPIPYPPYLNEDELVATGWTSSQDFTDFWQMIAEELKAFPNVIFEVWNEPRTPSGYDKAVVEPEFFGVVQQIIDTIRDTGAKHPIVVQWGYGSTWVYDSPSEHYTMYWVFDYPLSDSEGNIIYSTHGYRDYGSLTGYYGPYATRKCCYELEEIRQTWINCHLFEVAALYPLFLGEIGFDLDSPPLAPDGTDPMEAEKQAWSNILRLASDNGIHYNAFWFWTGGVRRLVQSGLPNYQGTYPGQVLIEEMTAYVPPAPVSPVVKALIIGTPLAVGTAMVTMALTGKAIVAVPAGLVVLAIPYLLTKKDEESSEAFDFLYD